MSGADAGWSGGAALVPFPVAVGTPLAGYAARTGAAVGTLDQLTIGALVLEREGPRLAIVAADVAAIDVDLAAAVSQAAGLPRSELVLCASHTHSGPAGIVARLHPADPNRLNVQLRARFVAAAAAAIGMARDRLEPVDVVTGGSTTEGVAANRNDPKGPYDDRLSVLATRRRDGTLQAVVVHFACHPTILGADNRLVSGDFPGVLRRILAMELTRGAQAPVVLFVNGAAGDVSTRFTRRAQHVAEVERVGTCLAMAAVDALAEVRVLTGPLNHAVATVRLSPRHGPEPRVGKAVMRRSSDGGASPGEERIATTRAQGAAMLAALATLPVEAIPSRLRLDAWTLGDLALVAVPGELFVSLGRHIAAASPAEAETLVLGYANGYAGYLADGPAHEAETYEALASPFAPDVGARVAVTAGRLVARLRAGPPDPVAKEMSGWMDLA